MSRHRKRKKHMPDYVHDAQKVAVHHVAEPAPSNGPAAPRAPAPASPAKIEWRAAEFHYFEKDYLWYVGVSATALVLLTFALIQRSFFFAVFVVIAAVLVIEFGKRRPRILDYELNDKSVVIDGRMRVPYKEMESFHIRKRRGLLDEIVFRRTTRVLPFMHLPIDEDLAVTVREFLLERLPEDEHEHSIVDIIAERIGF